MAVRRDNNGADKAFVTQLSLNEMVGGNGLDNVSEQQAEEQPCDGDDGFRRQTSS